MKNFKFLKIPPKLGEDGGIIKYKNQFNRNINMFFTWSERDDYVDPKRYSGPVNKFLEHLYDNEDLGSNKQLIVYEVLVSEPGYISSFYTFYSRNRLNFKLIRRKANLTILYTIRNYT